MKIVHSIEEMKLLSYTLQRAGNTIGLVPTMGALHEGHLSLLQLARDNSDVTVVSIFVNPTQFGPHEDYSKYPRPFEKDTEYARDAGCDIVFAPSVEEMYPPYYNTYVSVENITQRLCGAHRPDHFRGVTTVVLKLFTIINPHVAVFGQKDGQQVVVIKRMITDLHLMEKVIVGPTIREKDGLAMSSRNAYLNASERNEVSGIYRGLCKVKELYDKGERKSGALKQVVENEYETCPMFASEYIEIVDTTTLEPVEHCNGTVLVAVACRTAESGTRLIDNIVLGGSL